MGEQMLREELNGGKPFNLKEKADELMKKTFDMQEQMTENLNNMMNTTAENLDKAAEKMHETAEFFREKNMDSVKEDFSEVVKKNPAKALGGALLVGFLIGKIIFK